MRALAWNGNGLTTKLLWGAIALLGAVSLAIVALSRGEAVNAAWLVIASVCISAPAMTTPARIHSVPGR